MSAMTMRERMLAVVEGRPHDRVPFCQYENVNRCPMSDIWDVYGRENVGLLRWTQFHRFETPNCTVEATDIERNGMTGWRDTLHTPAGELYQEHLRQPDLGVSMIATHYVKEPADWEIVRRYLQDVQVVKDFSAFERNWKELGDDGHPHTRVASTPYQVLWIHWSGLENLVLHMMDYPDLLGEIIEILSGHVSKTIDYGVEAAAMLPVPYLNFSDNLAAPIIGLDNFEKYAVPFYNECREKLDERGIDIPVCCHADGPLKGLYEAMDKSALTMIESYTPPPDNDTPVAEAIRMWPYMVLGLNPPSSIHLADEEKIYACVMDILNTAGHTGRLRLQISENPPPGRWRYSYKPILKAIHDFGGPIG